MAKLNACGGIYLSVLWWALGYLWREWIYCLQECAAVWFGIKLATVRRSVLPRSWWLNNYYGWNASDCKVLVVKYFTHIFRYFPQTFRLIWKVLNIRRLLPFTHFANHYSQLWHANLRNLKCFVRQHKNKNEMRKWRTLRCWLLL